MAHFPPDDLLLSAWTFVSPLSKPCIAVQLVAALVGFVPAARRRLREVDWFTAILVGPPLIWVLLEISIGMILTIEYLPGLNAMFGWLTRISVIIGTTAVLQCILALQYTENPTKHFPVFGILMALLAIFGNMVFFLAVMIPGVN